MNNEEMTAAIRSMAQALFGLAETVNKSAQRNFAMQAELESVRVILQAFMATLQGEPAFAKQLQIRLKSAIEADRIVSLNTSTQEELILAREVWMKALVPAEMHAHVFSN